MSIKVSCTQCNKEFYVKPSIYKRGNVKYCSKKCQAEGYKVIPEEKKCLRCGKIFLVGGMIRKGIKHLSQLFCSRNCANAGMKKPRTMSESERGWFSGIFDGEGSIIEIKPPKKGWRITVGNTNKELLDKITEVVGIGNVSTNPNPKNPKHAQSWCWQINGANAYLILKQILPWLIVKREKAKKVLEIT